MAGCIGKRHTTTIAVSSQNQSACVDLEFANDIVSLKILDCSPDIFESILQTESPLTLMRATIVEGQCVDAMR